VTYEVEICPQARKSLVMKVTPDGVQVLIPRELRADSAEVQSFIQEGLSKLGAPDVVPADGPMSREDVLALVESWAERLEVHMSRVQVRAMRKKWGSISTAGTLTLASDLLDMPERLVEYVICHELLHLKVPTHSKLYRLLLSQHIPDWREREQELGRWALTNWE
jgi:predicted metal-dependent hydrolase